MIDGKKERKPFTVCSHLRPSPFHLLHIPFVLLTPTLKGEAQCTEREHTHTHTHTHTERESTESTERAQRERERENGSSQLKAQAAAQAHNRQTGYKVSMSLLLTPGLLRGQTVRKRGIQREREGEGGRERARESLSLSMIILSCRLRFFYTYTHFRDQILS
jgi:hypothetical protein